jgi:hypothetical protein
VLGPGGGGTRHGRRVVPDPSSTTARSAGAAGMMTGGSRPSAAARGEREAGRARPEARLGCCARCGGAGMRSWNGPKRKKVGGVKKKGF